MRLAESTEILYNLASGGVVMARDMAKKNETDYRWTKENCKMFSVKVRYDTGVPSALEQVKASGQSANAYIVDALVEKLRKDGYLPEA